MAVEGLSGAGKSRLLERVQARTGWPLLPEAWVRVHPRPSLAYRDPADLLRLEHRLLTEELRRYREARRRAATGTPVLLDTGFLGPVSYLRGLRAVQPEMGELRPPLLRRLRAARAGGRFGLADRYVYLDTPPPLALRRAARAAASHPRAWRARHVAVGLIERAFWLGSAPGMLPGRLVVLDGRTPLAERVSRIIELARSPPVPRSGSGLTGLLGALAQDP